MVDVANITLWGEFVGAIRWHEDEQLASFQYDSKFINNNWELSPIKMPLSQGSRIWRFPELRSGKIDGENTFKGLPGLLADALPDRYGNALINTWLVKNNRPENSMNPVEKLCFIGTRGMGALEFEPSIIKSNHNTSSVELETLVDVAKRMLHKRDQFLTKLSKDDEKAMLDILKIGTSAGGARPKAVIALNPSTSEVRSGQTNVPKGFSHWLIKLDGVSSEQFGSSNGWGRVEYAYYLMARDCQIEMSECSLLEENNRAHFLTKRFDRDGNVKHHVQSLCGLQHYDYNEMLSFSYEQLFRTMRILRCPYADAEQMYRRMVFNVIARNCDDHTKNFSFILKKNEAWRLAPAFDICYAYDPDNYWVNQQTLSVNGKRRGINKKDLLSIADANSIKEGEKIIKEINEVVKSWKRFAKMAKVSSSLQNRISQNLHSF